MLSGPRGRRYAIQSGAQDVDKLYAISLVKAPVTAQAISQVSRKIDVGSEVVNRGAEPTHNGAIVEAPAHFQIEDATQRGELGDLGSRLSLQG